ncbi:MAG: hypothetical protein KDA81_07155 [Planctomycetaceae bacterium]|nr:hypothetical protein [Planctomycetaceae bacterium]
MPLALDSIATAKDDDGIHVAASSPADADTVSMDTMAMELMPSTDVSAAEITTGSDTDNSAAELLLDEIRQLQGQVPPEDIPESRENRRERNLKIVELAARVLELTIADGTQVESFQEGIVQLLEARLQLALAGGDEEVHQLYADVQSLNDRSPVSPEAAEGIYCLARFAHLKARLEAGQNTVWLESFSRWAREFADRFPQQKSRSVALLFGAGRSCELHGLVAQSNNEIQRLMTEARLCYTSLVTTFPDAPETVDAAAVLRRLELPGKPLTQFSGPTATGGYITADDFRDRVTVVYFWDSTNEEFLQLLLPLLHQAEDVANNQLRFVGVNVDADPAECKTCLAARRLPGDHILFTDSDKVGWNSPLVKFWGITRVARVWLIDRKGTVHAVDVRHDQLVTRMRQLFRS